MLRQIIRNPRVHISQPTLCVPFHGHMHRKRPKQKGTLTYVSQTYCSTQTGPLSRPPVPMTYM